ncbi:MAG: 3'-5' exonuclease [Sphaerochaetaceae bacterium]|jgi:DNA polymerase-3 subunit epsilon
MQAVAIDFETADFHRQSACSVALVRFDSDSILEKYYTLLKPPSFCTFSPFNIQIHGITPSMVADSPCFSQVWPEMQDFIGADVLCAHNAPFDMGILESLIELDGFMCPPLNYLCTLKMARRLWKGQRSYALTSLSESLGLEYQAHYALDDAVNCARLFQLMTKGHMNNDLLELRKFLITRGVEIGRLGYRSR